MEINPEEIWNEHHPDQKIPGTEEPLDGNCGSRLRSKDLRELGIVRYCGNKAGKGTDHIGFGTCRHHLGTSAKHKKNAVVAESKKELAMLASTLEDSPNIDNPEIEAWKLATKMKQWTLILENKMDELNGMIATTDDAGVEHVRALIEVLERAWERYQSALEFMMKFDLRKRVLELEEHQARLVGQAFMAIILNQSMQLDEDQIDLARTLFAKQMTEMGAELEPSWAVGVTIDAEIVQ